MSKILGIESLNLIMPINMFGLINVRRALFGIAYQWAEITFLSSKAIDVKDVKHIYITQHSPPPPLPLLEWLK